MKPQRISVAIVGGGLVGTSLAIALAGRGVPSTVLERAERVPDLLRGELIMPSGVGVLDAIGVGDALREVSREISGVSLHHPAFAGGVHQVRYDRALVPLSTPASEPGTLPVEGPVRGLCGFRRDLYDTLREEARRSPLVDLRTGVEVIDVVDEGVEGATVVFSGGERLPTRWLVCADGASSRCRRALGFEAVFDERATSVQGFVGVARDLGETKVHVGVCEVGAVFVFPFAEGGFRCTIEVEECQRAALRTSNPLRTHLDILARALPEVYDKLGGDQLEVVSPLQVHPGRSLELGSTVRGRIALAGDAAGCVDPFAGYGMTLALLDVADLAATLSASPSPEALRGYEARRRARVAPRARATRELAYIFLNKTEGFAQPFAQAMAARWSDEAMIGPLVATEFAGFPPAITPSIGLRAHVMGLL